jgi:hypothetical protein
LQGVQAQVAFYHTEQHVWDRHRNLAGNHLDQTSMFPYLPASTLFLTLPDTPPAGRLRSTTAP